MDKTPHIFTGVTYCEPNKKVLKEWIWKTFRGSFCKDHSIRGDSFVWIGFWTKVYSCYYASISNVGQ